MDKVLDIVGSLVVGVGIGLLIYKINLVEPLIDECQANLPRSQQCVLTAVPEKEQTK